MEPSNKDIFEVLNKMKQENSSYPSLVEKDGKYGLMGADGDWIIEPRLLKAYYFFDDLCRAQDENGKWGWFNTEGHWVIPAKFDNAEAFKGDGLARVDIDGKRGEINMRGQWLIGPFDINDYENDDNK